MKLIFLMKSRHRTFSVCFWCCFSYFKGKLHSRSIVTDRSSSSRMCAVVQESRIFRKIQCEREKEARRGKSGEKYSMVIHGGINVKNISSTFSWTYIRVEREDESEEKKNGERERGEVKKKVWNRKQQEKSIKKSRFLIELAKSYSNDESEQFHVLSAPPRARTNECRRVVADSSTQHTQPQSNISMNNKIHGGYHIWFWMILNYLFNLSLSPQMQCSVRSFGSKHIIPLNLWLNYKVIRLG